MLQQNPTLLLYASKMGNQQGQNQFVANPFALDPVRFRFARLWGICEGRSLLMGLYEE